MMATLFSFKNRKHLKMNYLFYFEKLINSLNTVLNLDSEVSFSFKDEKLSTLLVFSWSRVLS